MTLRTPIWRWITRSRFTMSAAPAVAAATLRTVTAATAATMPAPTTGNPYSPAYHHAYRHGVIPTIPQAAKKRSWAAAHPAVRALSANDLNYGGGIDGIGVTTGHQKVYL